MTEQSTGSFAVIPAAAITDRRLSRSDLATLCALATYANRTGKCWPSTTTLAKDLNITTRMIRRCLRVLETCTHIRTTHRPGHRSIYLILGIKGSDSGLKGAGVEPIPGHPGSGEVDSQAPPKNAVGESAERTDVASSVDAEFESFWQSYPSRRPHSNPKKPALAKFKGAVKKGASPADIIRGAENYAALVRREGTEPKYVAMAQTWLNQQRWTDDQSAMSASEAAYDSDVIH